MTNTNSFTITEKALAWSVHLFTSSGLVAGFMAILAVQAHDWRTCMFWLIICLIIDGIDGTFARLFRVKEVLPYMDGTTIDYVIDFATYAIIPAYMFYEAQLVPESLNLVCTSIILLVSALYYGKTGMVSNDLYFVGFPVLWNMVVFYMIFIYDLSPMLNVLAIIFFAILHFVPIKFVYPSQGQRFRWLTISVTVIFILMLLLAVYFYPVQYDWITVLATICMIYYGFMAVYNTWLE